MNEQLIRRDYVANGGWETFLSYEVFINILFFPKNHKLITGSRAGYPGGVAEIEENGHFGSLQRGDILHAVESHHHHHHIRKIFI